VGRSRREISDIRVGRHGASRAVCFWGGHGGTEDTEVSEIRYLISGSAGWQGAGWRSFTRIGGAFRMTGGA
jgi:hypothetical protein